MNTNKTNLGVLLVLFVLIGVAFYFNTTINPLRADLETNRVLHEDERLAAEERIRRGREAEARYRELEQRIEHEERQYQAILATLPTRRDAGELVHAIEDAASATGATLTAITPNPNETPLSTDVVFTTVALTADGNYEQLRAFLERLETLPRSAQLTLITLRRHSNTDWRNPTLTLEATLETYLYRSGGAQNAN